MFSQERTGRFIAECRKEKGLTQKELAEKLSLSDKTISKWETGNGMPDSAIMQTLCEILDINVNELLSGERLSESSYNGKAEENMVELIKENEQAKGSKVGTIVAIILGIVMMALFIFSLIGSLAWFIDIPSLVWVLGCMLLVLGLSGRFNDLVTAFSYCFGKRRKIQKEDTAERRHALGALRIGRHIAILSGTLGSLVGVVLTIGVLGSPEKMGPNLALAILTLFYGCTIAMIFTVISARIEP